MEFIGTITQLREVSGTDKYGQMYKGVEATVMESRVEEGRYQNKCVVYIKDASAAQFPIGTEVVVEARTDIQVSQNGSGRKYTTVNMHFAGLATF